MKAKKIILQEEFVVGILIGSYQNYKQQFKHKHKQLTLIELITHIIMEDTNCKELHATKTKALAIKAKMVQHNSHNRSHTHKSSFASFKK